MFMCKPRTCYWKVQCGEEFECEGCEYFTPANPLEFGVDDYEAELVCRDMEAKGLFYEVNDEYEV